MPLLWLSLAFLAGILAAGWISQSTWVTWIVCVLITLPLGLLLHRLPPGQAGLRGPLGRLARVHPTLKVAPVLLLTLFGLGGLRYSLAHLPVSAADLAWYNDKGRQAMVAWVSADPSRRESTTLLRVEVTELFMGKLHRPVTGAAQVMLPPGSNWVYGDRLLLYGEPQTPPENEDFSYRDYLATQGISTYLAYPSIFRTEGRSGSWFLQQVFRLRAAGVAVLARLYPPPAAQLLQGILLGVDEGIPADVVRSFQATGIAHVIAISGFNMCILCALFMGLFRRFLSRWWAALAAVFALAGYAVLAGGGPSVIRAGVMCALALAAVQLGREAGGLNSLVVAAGVMCLFDPNLPWNVGFQLSVAATLGLLLYAGPLQEGFASHVAVRLPSAWRNPVAGPVGEYLLCTLAAQATTLAIIVWHFRRISLSSLIANPLVLPAQPPLMVLGGLSLLAGLVWEPLGQLLAGAGWFFAAWTLEVARRLAEIPAGEITLGPTGAAFVMLGCVALLLAFLLRAKLREINLSAVLVLLPLIGLAAFMGRSVAAGGDGRFHLVAYDLPGGPAVLLRDPHGQALLIGGSDSAVRLEEDLGRWLPPNTRFGGVIVPSGVNQKGLPGVVERFQPAQAYLCPDSKELKAGLEKALREGNVKTELLAPGRVLNWGEVRIEVLDGCALRVHYRSMRFLLPGLASPDELAGWILDDPGLVILSGGEDWNLEGARVLSPPPGGWVHVSAVGERMWVEEERK
jgi:competence protein ComEC